MEVSHPSYITTQKSEYWVYSLKYPETVHGTGAPLSIALN